MRYLVLRVAIGACGVLLCVGGAVAGNVAVFAGGVVIVIAAILGGGLKAFGVEIPAFPREVDSDDARPGCPRDHATDSSYTPHTSIGIGAGRWEPSAAVRHAQSLLHIPPDGRFGTGTKGAVLEFQRTIGIAPDGIIGRDTWSHLHPTVKRGGSGPAVAELQAHLRVPVDGRFGELTEAAVKSFQVRAGLAADGIVGPDTWRAILFNNGK